MNISLKSITSVFLSLLLLPSFAFAWGDMGNASANNTTSSVMPAASISTGLVGGKETTFDYQSSVKSFTPKISSAFQTIINLIDLPKYSSQSLNTPATISNLETGLNSALKYNGTDKYLIIPQLTAILNNQQLPESTKILSLNNLLNINTQEAFYLYGNDLKATEIQPLTSILMADKYTPETKLLVLQNLEAISRNDYINISDKFKIVDPLISFTEKSVQSQTWSDNALICFHNSLKSIFRDSNLSQEQRDSIAVKLIDQTSPLWSENRVINSVFIALEEYLLSEETSLDIKNTIIGFSEEMLSMVNSDSNLPIVAGFIRSLAAATQDSRLNKPTLIKISDTIHTLLNNTNITLEYPQKLACLSTLYSIAQNSALNGSTEKNEIIQTITTLGINQQNKSIWNKYGILVFVEPKVETLVDNASWQQIDADIAKIPADRRPLVISLQDTMSEGNEQESLANVGNYDSAILTIDLKINSALKLKSTYLYHETGHFLQENIMTQVQINEWDKHWSESKGIEDFADGYSTTNKYEDCATILEIALDESYLPEGQKPLFTRAQAQAQAGDTTLLDKYNLAKEIWGIS